MEIISNQGRTSVVFRVNHGLVWKSQRTGMSVRFLAEIAHAFNVERQLLERLGIHPRIVRFYGLFRTGVDAQDGLLLEEAVGGDLQSYIDRNQSKLSDPVRRAWSLQLAEGLAYVHSKGIVHSNMSTTNVFVQQLNQTTHLVLGDFGGSSCRVLDLDGGLVPDDPFRDPLLTTFDSPKVDVFSLGIIIYVIMTGHYPFHQGPAPQGDERYSYEDRVQQRFAQGDFPNLSGVHFGEVIAGCCCERRFETAKEVVAALQKCAATPSGYREFVAVDAA